MAKKIVGQQVKVMMASGKPTEKQIKEAAKLSNSKSKKKKSKKK